VNREVSAAARGISSRDTPLDVPLGPDYVLGLGIRSQFISGGAPRRASLAPSIVTGASFSLKRDPSESQGSRSGKRKP